MYRLIHRLRIVFGRTEQRGSREVCVNLDPNGCDKRKGGLRPRAPKTRVVDLRLGDKFLDDGQWRTVLDIYVDSERLLTDEQAAEHRTSGSNHGWLVKAPEGYVSPLTGGSRRTDGR